MTSPRLSLSSALRPPAAVGPAPLARLAADAGYDGVALAAGCDLGLVPGVAAEAAGAGLEISTLRLPMAESPLPPRKRVPYLAALDDRDERLAAVALVQRGFEVARTFAVELFTLDLGPAPLVVPERELRLAFGRREMDEGERGAKVLRAALDHRRAMTERLLDAVRFSLERVLAAADRFGVRVALPFAPSPWGVPSPREALEILDELRGAPLGLVWDPARWQALGRLGLTGVDRTAASERAKRLRQEAFVVREADTVGLEADLLPGLGDRPPTPEGDAAAEARPPLFVVTGRSDSTAEEVTAARHHAAGTPA